MQTRPFSFIFFVLLLCYVVCYQPLEVFSFGLSSSVSRLSLLISTWCTKKHVEVRYGGLVTFCFKSLFFFFLSISHLLSYQKEYMCPMTHFSEEAWFKAAFTAIEKQCSCNLFFLTSMIVLFSFVTLSAANSCSFVPCPWSNFSLSTMGLQCLI